MFLDLMDEEIRPEIVDMRALPEIVFETEMRKRIENMLLGEEKFAKVLTNSVIVQTNNNYVMFPNQWFILAVLCKKYAEALKTYCDFFEDEIKDNQVLINAIGSKQLDNEEFVSLIPEMEDRQKIVKFVLSDKNFRKGKSLLNIKKKSGEDYSNEDEINEIPEEEKVYAARGTKDLFCSCVLKQIPVPDASSTYLGNLVFYLVKNPELYQDLLQEVQIKLGYSSGMLRLPHRVKDCAKKIVDRIYDIDKFHRLEMLFKVNENSLNIDVAKTGGLLTTNSLRYMFERQNSPRYGHFGQEQSARAYMDKDYEINCNGERFICRLSDQWKGSELTENDQGNNLNALILLVNKYYGDVIKIRKLLGDRFIMNLKQDFLYKDLPEMFKTAFSRRYITSLMAKPFVILTGNSGTGKTRISKQFAEYLEYKYKKKNENGEEIDKKNWMIVPVGADWTDNSRILGFYNPLGAEGSGKYEKTGVLELIEEANEHSDIPYFLILDEMNLSHVERYFSDFLSHMETPDIPFALDGYEEEIKYPKNLFVIGTVNIDETTYMFSPKVLDRANVIEFKPQKDAVIKLFTGEGENSAIVSANDGSAEAFLRLAKEIQAGKLSIDLKNIRYYEDSDSEKSNMGYVETVFSEIYEIVEINNFEFAFRTVKEIRQYISAAYEFVGEDEFNLTQVIDEQLLQKVLPKIHGNNKEIGQLLIDLDVLCDKYKLELSKKKIGQMKGKLEKVQYASFI